MTEPTPVPLYPPRYARPPIVETVVELQFARKVGKERLYDAMKAKLGHLYQGKPTQIDTVRLQAVVSADRMETSAQRTTHLRCLRSRDGLRLVGCGAEQVTVHALAPYPGWENLREQLDEVINALPTEARESNITVVVLRYVDRIELPPGDTIGSMTTSPACRRARRRSRVAQRDSRFACTASTLLRPRPPSFS